MGLDWGSIRLDRGCRVVIRGDIGLYRGYAGVRARSGD